MWSGICFVATTRIGFWTESDLHDTVDWGRKWLFDFNTGKIQIVLLDWSNNSGGIDVKMDGSVSEKNSSFIYAGVDFLF